MFSQRAVGGGLSVLDAVEAVVTDDRESKAVPDATLDVMTAARLL